VRRMKLAALLTATATRQGAGSAVRHEDRTLSYRRLERATARFATLLRDRGLGAGDHVAVQVPETPELVIVHHGALRAGAVIVAIDPGAGSDVIAERLGRSGAPLLCAWHGLAEAAEKGAAAAGADCLFVTPRELDRLLARTTPAAEAGERATGDPALLDPRLGTVTHGELRRGASALIERHELGPDDVVLAVLAPDAARDRACLWTAVAATGACLVLPAARDAGAAVSAVRRHGVTVLLGPDEFLREVREHPKAAAAGTPAPRMGGI
jgi:long-chain acyl-CoA synthetase